VHASGVLWGWGEGTSMCMRPCALATRTWLLLGSLHSPGEEGLDKGRNESGNPA
jgi:hypothetical protein